MRLSYAAILLLIIESRYALLAKKESPSSHLHHLLHMKKPPGKVSKPTLDENTYWQLSLTFRDPENQQVDVTRANLGIRFINDRNYEPPQGRIFVEDDYNGLVKVDEAGYNGIWTLSEDKNDRKDGLWVWGLFEEPKYPYLYFYLDVYDTIVTEKGEEVPIYANKMHIPNGRLNFRFDHYQDKSSGAVLLNGCMTYKLTELVKADPLGLGGKVNVGESVTAGVANIVATTPSEAVVD